MKKIKRLWNKKSKILIFLIIFLCALYINFFILPDLKIYSNDVEKIKENDTTYLNIGSFDLTQEDVVSGDFNSIFWKIIYLGNARDRICFEKDKSLTNQSFYASYNKGEYYNIVGKKCFKISKEGSKITFNLRYEFDLEIPEIELLPKIVNKSDCIWIISENTCITQEGIDKKQTIVLFPQGEVYLESNLFHKIIKFIFIFFSTGALLWAFSRTIILIKYGFKNDNKK
ncbi:hypothetical protein KAI04_00030 [Candidatus Pacearchaeota archaeon]|nr:hypothetical protein [Candidatus Pacearchaeota archaeon]